MCGLCHNELLTQYKDVIIILYKSFHCWSDTSDTAGISCVVGAVMGGGQQ